MAFKAPLGTAAKETVPSAPVTEGKAPPDVLSVTLAPASWPGLVRLIV